ncbi:MAG: AAA family ATPase [Candidatus Omnitrophica bacterium]|nr:AAA family ATPase [Candidatus Omnitrophota bacterium]MBD3269801.1 AAA family ATPase [Candidatus Omnitrophota bacterium]
MYLKELSIFGFKSFPQKISLKFESGITVVVGPNGCGKSNIFDAIKWSLGEQSPKSLRGVKMEDIIFNGTERVPAMNYAEVFLTFCNEDEYLPIDFKEVVVGRRLYRSGESQYFINKNPVRLKDIQNLFMGTGVGESTYSFVEQGKIEIFLSYKPEDKRLIFDEASGIIKYKERKRETLRRLNEAEENMLRLEDIMSEVRRQIRYLQRQVDRAKQYKEVEGDLIRAEKVIAAVNTRLLEEKIERVQTELGTLEGTSGEKNAELLKANNKWEELHRNIKSIREELQEASSSIVSLEAKLENVANNIEVQNQRIKEMEERNRNLDSARDNFLERLKLQEERNRKEIERFAQIEKEIALLNNKIESYRKEKENLANKVEESRKETSGLKETVLELETKRSKSNNIIVEIQANLNTLTNRKKRLSLDKARLDSLVGENNEKSRKAEEEFNRAEESLKKIKEKKGELIRRQDELVKAKDNLQADLMSKEKELFELKASYEFLKDLRLRYETFSEKKKITVIFAEEPVNINKLVASLQNVNFQKEGQSYRAQIEAKIVSFEERQLEERMDFLSKEIENIKSSQKEIERERVELGERLSSENERIEAESNLFQEKLQERDGLRKEAERLEEESGILEEEIKTALSEIEDFQHRQKEMESEKDGYENSLSETNNELARHQDIINEGTERLRELDIEIAQSEAGKQSLFKEKDTLQSKIEFFKGETDNICESVKNIEKERKENLSRIESFLSDIKNSGNQSEKYKNEIEDISRKKEDLQRQETKLSQSTEVSQKEIDCIDSEIEEIQNSIYNKKLKVQELEYEKNKIKDYINQVYNIDFDIEEVDTEEVNLETFSQQREKLKKKLKSLGEVNLVAIEEFEELKKREEFLENQKKDLIDSKDNLKKAIQKINRTSKELFIDTFSKIQEEFRKIFKFLFNGGKANLILLDPENVLDSGVDIEVQPPGKKLQNVSLLSGGEKALTAISLIFAIFRVRPSPLCVLDEIDAPLDEANVGRFNHILKEFSSFSQFILITHNKRTMSNADVLYGVTMQEKGISKLVSVKFASEEEVPSSS